MENIENKLSELEKRISVLEATIQHSPNPQNTGKQKDLSIKEFLIQKNAQNVSIVEKTLVICYFLENHLSTNPFNSKDIEDVFRLAKEKPPTNVADMINKNVKKGLLMEDKEKKDNKKAFTLTSTGESYVENLDKTVTK